MRSRNTLLLLVLLVLIGAAVYYFSRKDKGMSTLDSKETAFAVSDTASVDKIFIAYKSGQSHTLERKANNTWMLDNKFEAQKSMVNMLLETLKRIEVKRPADKASRNGVIRDFATMGRKVEIYQKGQLSKTFYVGLTTDNDLGTYFIMEDSEEPYVVHIPGFSGFLNTRFDITELYWRSVPVFRSTAQTLEELKLDYAGQPNESFSIKKEGDKFTVSGMENVNQEDVKAYLENYKFVNGEYYLPNPMNRVSDSLALKKPVAVISVKDKNPANSRTFTLYAKPDDLDRLTAVDQKNRDIISVQTFVFNRLLVRRAAFGKK
jgi:uncharacterized protein (UPF0333 family)